MKRYKIWIEGILGHEEQLRSYTTSDTGCLENYDYDTVIENNDGFAELRQKAKEYCEEMTK